MNKNETGLEIKLELNEVSHLVGQLLTIADAAFENEVKREAVKSLIKNTVWKWGKDWHFAATEEQIRAFTNEAEECETPCEPQIAHYEE